ncbi:MAG: nuclear transport factor 2 family protein [Saprospiraceae bacterium]|nr:nuclear transport factor 2 family protein [Saprospiraceae bacterium]
MSEKLFLILLVSHMLFSTCSTVDQASNLEAWKSEIEDAEKSFANMAAEQGIAKAFLTYAAPEAVLMRNNKIIQGIDEMQNHFDQQSTSGSENLTWSPDFIDVSSSGDLGYTYGQYTYSGIDAEGQIFESKGIFHTVWKRQSDGTWRFVWD